MGGGTGGGGPHRAWQAWEVAPDLELRSSLGSPEPDPVPGLSGGRCSRGIPALSCSGTRLLGSAARLRQNHLGGLKGAGGCGEPLAFGAVGGSFGGSHGCRG